MIYLDYDINRYTDLYTLNLIHKLFEKYNKVHTIAIIMDCLWDSRGVWEWVTTTPNVEVTLHGWRHSDYALENYMSVLFELKLAKGYWNNNRSRCTNLTKDIVDFYPPWNSCSPDVVKACESIGLVYKDVSLGGYFTFHWWEYVCGRNLDKLEEVLRHEA